MNDIRRYLKASGRRIMAGMAGQVYAHEGKIVFEKAPHLGIDENLYALLHTVVDELKIAVEVNSIDTGVHVTNSRHYRGMAVDINHIGPMRQDHPQVSVHNEGAVRLLHLLTANGWVAGHERPGEAAVLLGPVGTEWNQTQLDHSSHIHISIA